MIDLELRRLPEVERYFLSLPAAARASAALAINASAKWAARDASRRIRLQVALPRNYIGDASNPDAKLRIRKTATGADLEAVLSAAQRPVSLARFVAGNTPIGRNRGQVHLRVKPGRSTTIPGAFLIRLPAGQRFDETHFNLGLALRLKPGERVRNKHTMQAIAKGLVLLYGPSIDQIFQTVREDIAPGTAQQAVSEFLRQFARRTA